MDNIDLFDRYIKGWLSAEERAKFVARLSSDKAFATDFKVYCTTIVGICREAEQDNLDFGIAMKQMSKDELREIIDPHFEVSHKVNMSCSNLQFGMCDNEMDLSVKNCSLPHPSNSKSHEPIDICALSCDELKEYLPRLFEAYKYAKAMHEKAQIGYKLAIANIILHERDRAKDILNSLIERFNGNKSYEDFVAKCKSTLDMIK